MKFTRYHLFTIFQYLFFFVVISPFIERLEAIGKPNLSLVRMALAILLLFATVPFYLQKGFMVNKKGVIIVGVLYALLGYILLSAGMFKEEFNQITFYLIYVHLVFLGYIAVFPETLPRFERLIGIICIIAILVGTIMMIAGPEKIKAIGIGELEGKWGQFALTDTQTTSIDISLFFRSFSIFVDHQAFSGFLQLSAFFYRFLYEIKKEKKYVVAIIVLLLANTLTFSTTGYLAILLVLLSMIRLRYVAIIAPGLILVGFYLYALFPQIALVMFHQGSFAFRIAYIQRALEMIGWLPSLHEIWKVDFSADCYVLWMTYKYGIVYAVLQFILLLSFVFLLSGRKTTAEPILLVILFLINIISNGACFSTPNNILMPVLFGMVTAYSLRYHPKEPCNGQSARI